jgi:hypothetical protein
VEAPVTSVVRRVGGIFLAVRLEFVLGRAKSRLDVTSGDRALEGLLSALAMPIEPKVEPRPDDSEFEDS